MKAETDPAHLAPQSVNLKVQEVNFDHFILSSFLTLGKEEEGGRVRRMRRGEGEGDGGSAWKTCHVCIFFFSFSVAGFVTLGIQ